MIATFYMYTFVIAETVDQMLCMTRQNYGKEYYGSSYYVPHINYVNICHQLTF
jgi:hypothetical protein